MTTLDALILVLKMVGTIVLIVWGLVALGFAFVVWRLWLPSLRDRRVHRPELMDEEKQ